MVLLQFSRAIRSGRQRRSRLSIFQCSTVLLATFTSLLPTRAAGQGLEGRTLKPLVSNDLATLAAALDPKKSVDLSNPNSHLSHILIPRPPSSENNTIVRQYIVSTLEKLNWHVEEDHFQDKTPYGVKDFTNIIATRNPKASKRVILSAHFDSKFFSTSPENQFVGATDSAAPCAMMLDVAEVIGPLLDARQKRYESGEEDEDENIAGDSTLQLVFFDGEEAFKDWTATDSIYGSRHLAEKWATTYLSPHAVRRLNPAATMLSNIEHLILLDLLGASGPLIRSYYPSTGWLFDAFISAEHRLGEAGLLNEEGQAAWATWNSFFVPRTGYSANFGHIEDDHIPFLRRGVNVLHLIASPFPRVWHTLADDASALDMATMKRWNLILRVVMAEYLGLRPEGTRTTERGVPSAEANGSHTELASSPWTALFACIFCPLLVLAYTLLG